MLDGQVCEDRPLAIELCHPRLTCREKKHAQSLSLFDATVLPDGETMSQVRPIYETLAPLSPRAGAQAQETIDYTRDQWQANAAQLMAEHQAHAASTSPAAKPSAGVPRVPSDSVFSLDDVQ